MRRLVRPFQRLLEAMVGTIGQRLWELPLLAEAEREQVLVEWNRPEGAPRAQCVHELFEAQVERRRSAVAVVCEEQQMRYGS